LNQLQSSKEHLPGLDALRGISAIAVIVFHIEQIKSFNRLPNLMDYGFFAGEGGRNAVILFFVLSGYLITKNLLKERSFERKISYKRFYLKRILRIWPLYYLVLFLSAWALDYTPKESTFWMCIFIFPNVAHASIGGWVANPPIWTIGAEEQFYLTWPWVIDKFRTHTLTILIAIIVIITVLPFILIWLVENHFPRPGLANQVKTIFAATKFNTFALGGLCAYIFHKHPNWALHFREPVLSTTIILIPFIFWFSGVSVPYLNDELYALFFSVLIVHVSLNRGGGFLFNNSILNYLGKISYGIYLFHHLAIILGLRYVPPVFFKSLIASNIVYYIIVFSTTVMVATISYYGMERYFLRLKSRL
jgi:peptidoglycan/LPS O-acetylase OafA/YrhL